MGGAASELLLQNGPLLLREGLLALLVVKRELGEAQVIVQSGEGVGTGLHILIQTTQLQTQLQQTTGTRQRSARRARDL